MCSSCVEAGPQPRGIRVSPISPDLKVLPSVLDQQVQRDATSGQDSVAARQGVIVSTRDGVTLSQEESASWLDVAPSQEGAAPRQGAVGPSQEGAATTQGAVAREGKIEKTLSRQTIKSYTNSHHMLRELLASLSSTGGAGGAVPASMAQIEEKWGQARQLVNEYNTSDPDVLVYGVQIVVMEAMALRLLCAGSWQNLHQELVGIQASPSLFCLWKDFHENVLVEQLRGHLRQQQQQQRITSNKIPRPTSQQQQQLAQQQGEATGAPGTLGMGSTTAMTDQHTATPDQRTAMSITSPGLELSAASTIQPSQPTQLSKRYHPSMTPLPSQSPDASGDAGFLDVCDLSPSVLSCPKMARRQAVSYGPLTTFLSAHLAHRLAAMGCCNARLWQLLGNFILPLFESESVFPEGHLAVVLASFAEAGYHHVPMFKAAAAQSENLFPEVHLAVVLASFAQAGYHHVPMFKAAAAQFESLFPEGHLAVVLASFAQAGYHHVPIFKSAAAQLNASPPNNMLSPQHLAWILKAFSEVAHYDTQLFNNLARQANRRLQDKEFDYLSSLWTLQPPPVVEHLQLQAASSVKLPYLESSSLSSLWTLRPPPDAERSQLQAAGAFRLPDLADVAWACVHMRHSNNELFAAIGSEATSLVLRELSSPELAASGGACSSMGLDVTRLVLSLDENRSCTAGFLDAAALALEQASWNIDPKDVPRMLKAYCNVSPGSNKANKADSVYAGLASTISSRVGCLTPTQLADLLDQYATMGLYEEKLLRSVASHLAARHTAQAVPTKKSLPISSSLPATIQALQAMARLSFHDSYLVELGPLQSADVVRLVWALASLPQSPQPAGSHDVLLAAAQMLGASPHTLSFQQLIEAVWSLSLSLRLDMDEGGLGGPSPPGRDPNKGGTGTPASHYPHTAEGGDSKGGSLWGGWLGFEPSSGPKNVRGSKAGQEHDFSWGLPASANQAKPTKLSQAKPPSPYQKRLEAVLGLYKFNANRNGKTFFSDCFYWGQPPTAS
eukprot:gene28748-31928_t